MIFTRVRGIPRTRAALTKATLQLEAASPTAVRIAGESVAKTMSAFAPRRTGRLASSIGVDVSGTGTGATAKVGSEVPYDRFVQRGTVYMAAQPYGQDAGDSATAEIVAAMVAVYKAALTRGF